MLSNALVQDLSVSTGLHTLHEDDLRRHEGELQVQMGADYSGPNLGERDGEKRQKKK